MVLNRYHWRLRCGLAAAALVLAVALALVALSLLVVSALIVVAVTWQAVRERDQLAPVVSVLLRWRVATVALGMCAKGEKGPVPPRLGRVWVSADTLHLEFRPWREPDAQPLGERADDLARRLGFVAGRVHQEKAGHLFGVGRVVVELRRKRVLASQEVKVGLPVPRMQGLPELVRPKLTSRMPEPPGEPCTHIGRPGGPEEWLGRTTLQIIEEHGWSIAERLVELPGYGHLPDSCRPHAFFFEDGDEAQWQEVSGTRRGEYVLPCARWREPAPLLSDVARLSAAAPASMVPPASMEACTAESERISRERTAYLAQHPRADAAEAVARIPEGPLTQQTLNSEGSHYWCIQHYRRGGHHQADPPPLRAGGFAALDGETWREALAAVPVGVKAGGRPWRLSLIDNHVLIAGMTGAGKGSVVWSLAVGLAPAVAAGAVQLWGLDPKRVELAMGLGLWHRYAADPEAMVSLLEDAVAGLHARTAQMAGRVRRFEPSPQMPLIVVLCDELGYLMALMPQDRENKHRQRAETALTTLLALGRACGFVVVGALQDPRKEVIDNRDLFPTRVGMRLSHRMVDLVLGSKAYEQGAHCDRISPDAPGTAYVVDEERGGEPVEVRAFWVSDAAIRQTEAAVLAWRERVSVPRSQAVERQAPEAMGGTRPASGLEPGAPPPPWRPEAIG